MIRLLADENFNGKIVRGIRRLLPATDIIRVQDTVMYQADDPKLLEWAAQENRILLTHDIETMVGYANERIAAGQHMSGLFAVRDIIPVSQVIDDLLVILGASEMKDWENIVTFLPL